MKNKVLAVTLAIGLIGLAGTANASFMINLGGCDFSADGGGTGSCGGSGADLPPNALTLTFENNGANTVRLTIDAGNMPAGTAKISDVWFNVDSGLSFGDLGFAYVSGVAVDSPQATKGIIAGGNVASAGIFDIKFHYKTSGALGDFYGPLTSVYDITASGLTENSFDDLSSKGSLAAFHLNITGNGESGHYAAVPVPATILLVGSGLLGLMGIRRKDRE